MMMIFGARAVFLLPAISSEHLCRLEGSSRARDGGTARGVARAAAAQNVAALRELRATQAPPAGTCTIHVITPLASLQQTLNRDRFYDTASSANTAEGSCSQDIRRHNKTFYNKKRTFADKLKGNSNISRLRPHITLRGKR